MSAAHKSDRRRFQFSLSSLFWLTTLVALVCAAGRVFAGQPSDSWVITAGTFLGTFAFFSIVLAGPLLVVIVSDFLKTTVRKVAAICGICVFLLLALLVLAVLTTGSEACVDFQDPDASWVSLFDTATWQEGPRLTLEGGLHEAANFTADGSRVLLADLLTATTARDVKSLFSSI